MEIQIYKKDLANAVAIAKRVLKKEKTKTNLSMSLLENSLIVYTTSPEISTYTFVPIQEGMVEKRTITVSIKELDAITESEKGQKGKKGPRELRLSVDQKQIMNMETKKKCKLKEEAPFEVPEVEKFIPLKDEKRIIEIFKESANILCDEGAESAKNLRISPKKTLAMEPRRIHLTAIDETDFAFEKIFIPKDVIKNVLATSLGKNIRQFWSEGQWMLQDETTLYQFSVKEKIGEQPINRTNTLKTFAAFTVNGEEIAKKISELKEKKKSKNENEHISFQLLDENTLCITQKREEPKKETISVRNVKGTFKEAVFDLKVAQEMFSAYPRETQVRLEYYENMHGKKGIMWKIAEKQKVIMAGTVIEPDRKAYYEKQKAH